MYIYSYSLIKPKKRCPIKKKKCNHPNLLKNKNHVQKKKIMTKKNTHTHTQKKAKEKKKKKKKKEGEEEQVGQSLPGK